MALTSQMERDVPEDAVSCDDGKKKTVLDLSSQDLQSLVLNSQCPGQGFITELIVNFNVIACLPDGFARSVPNLKVFQAKGNKLEQLPPEFGSLTSLCHVDLSGNQLKCLPDSVQCLVNLQRLHLTSNDLGSLPEDFGELSSLEELFIDQNKLSKLPSTFALLDKLRTLEASHNKLSVLPKYLGSMCSLSSLSLCQNCLQILPESFSQLENLVFLDVSHNDLESLPQECSSLRTLKKVFLGFNQLKEIPQWLGHLPELTELCLKENKVSRRGFSEDFGKVCKKLRRLNVSGNSLVSLPDTFGELESLEWVHFGGMQEDSEHHTDAITGNWLSNLPASFSQLAHLTWLRLDENSMNFLPKDFGSLRCLEYLDLGKNLLHEIPESFGQLHKLRVCLLTRNYLQLLPSTFGELTALEKVCLDHNELAELPESFRNLTQLKTLDLYRNRLTEVPTALDLLVNLEELNLDENRLEISWREVPALQKKHVYKPRPVCAPDVDSVDDAEEADDSYRWGQYANCCPSGDWSDEDEREDEEKHSPLPSAEEEDWDEECDASEQPVYSKAIQIRMSCLRSDPFYLCPAEYLACRVRRKNRDDEPAPVIGQFDSADDHAETQVVGDAAAVARTQMKDADNTETHTDDSAHADSDDLSISDDSVGAPAPSLPVVSAWAPFDLHVRRIVRPRYDDPHFKEPQPDRGQFVSVLSS